MKRETFVGVGGILFVAGIIVFLMFNPSYTSLSNRLAGYETGSISKADYQHYILLNTTVMPIINILIAIGIALLLMGALEIEKK